MDRIRLLTILSLCLGLWLTGRDAAWGQFTDFSPAPSSPGVTSRFLNFLSCYDILDGHYLDCQFTHQILGLKEPATTVCTEPVVNAGLCANGGHQHEFSGHPLGRLVFNLGMFPIIVSDRTNRDVALVIHEMPEVAGQVQTKTRIVPPPGYVCVAQCDDVTITLDVRVKGLEILPPRQATDQDDYVTLRGGTDTHPEGHWATRASLDTLREIAREYRALTGRPLSVNDLSLPRGGLFDINGGYAPPHRTHRIGTDADINRAGVDCASDQSLKDAVASVAKLRPGAQLICESAGRPDPNGPFKHIDLE